MIKKRDQFRYAISSDLDESWKKFIIQDFQNELIKYNMDGLGDLFIKSEFRMIPERTVDDVLLATLWKWIEKQRLAINIPQLLDSLKSKMQFLRCERGSLNLDEINQLVRAQSTESITTQIIKEVYLHFSNPSQILSVLGEIKEDILLRSFARELGS
ncbi:hypothetical protein [Pelosinus baikalensis]|uniref:Death domain-containing protein n=1 Tax=Pelosinus baikalensis TaxID=2892015 RepID=A0ABS8I131_9FIRM|nr:hypothetical protein [Pelosinus baikalensis]MCC5468599.1 hypothetical protein [Pelosinus baikalensis]